MTPQPHFELDRFFVPSQYNDPTLEFQDNTDNVRVAKWQITVLEPNVREETNPEKCTVFPPRLLTYSVQSMAGKQPPSRPGDKMSRIGLD